MYSTYENNGRTPIICLNYKEHTDAVNGELMVDYDTGNIFIVDIKDRTVIHDLTNSVAKLLQNNFPGNAIELKVDGFGTVNVSKYLSGLNKRMLQPSNCNSNPNEDSQANWVPNFFLDMQSLTVNTDGIVSIKKFEDAKDRQIFTKINGLGTWVTKDFLTYLETETAKNSAITITGHHTYTLNLSGDPVNIILNTEDTNPYQEITCYIILDNIIPIIGFPRNIHWESDISSKLYKNTIHRFVFFTLDAGLTWYGEVHKFSNTSTPITGVDTEYLVSNYYNKDTINQLLNWHGNQAKPASGPNPVQSK